MGRGENFFLILGLSILGPIIFLLGCIILICVLIKRRKQKVRPHISVATKSAAPDAFPNPPPQPQSQEHRHPHSPPPPSPIPPPPHLTNGGVYRAHDVLVTSPSYPGYPPDTQTCSSPPYPANPPSHGPNPAVYYDSVQ